MQAAKATLDEVKALGGTGGVIVLSHDGSVALSMNTEGMFRGRADATGPASGHLPGRVVSQST